LAKSSSRLASISGLLDELIRKYAEVVAGNATAVRPIPPVAEWGSPLATLRALRKHVFG
jgi:hypothetical protein